MSALNHSNWVCSYISVWQTKARKLNTTCHRFINTNLLKHRHAILFLYFHDCFYNKVAIWPLKAKIFTTCLLLKKFVQLLFKLYSPIQSSKYIYWYVQLGLKEFIFIVSLLNRVSLRILTKIAFNSKCWATMFYVVLLFVFCLPLLHKSSGIYVNLYIVICIM